MPGRSGVRTNNDRTASREVGPCTAGWLLDCSKCSKQRGVAPRSVVECGILAAFADVTRRAALLVLLLLPVLKFEMATEGSEENGNDF